MIHGVVGEHCLSRRSVSESTRGGMTRAAAGMSSDKLGENPNRRKPKGSCTRLVRAGLVET